MQWAQKQKGFTIVELLIVVVVIAILAAVTIVAYNGISNRAKASAAASLASQVQKKLELYAVDNAEQYPATLADAGIDAATAANVQYSTNGSSSAAGYCITATQNSSSSYVAKGYEYTTTAPQTLNQTNPSEGVCPGHAQNNGATTVNLVENPASRSNGNGWNAIASTVGVSSGGRVTSVSGLSALGITTAYRNTLSGAASSWWRVQNDPSTPVTPGQEYTLSGYIRTSVTAATGVIIIWENGSGANMGENSSVFGSQNGGTWARKSVTATAPAGAVSARYHFGASTGSAAGAYIDATAAMFTPGSNLPGYADGDSAGWVWVGASNASTSRGPAL